MLNVRGRILLRHWTIRTICLTLIESPCLPQSICRNSARSLPRQAKTCRLTPAHAPPLVQGAPGGRARLRARAVEGREKDRTNTDLISRGSGLVGARTVACASGLQRRPTVLHLHASHRSLSHRVVWLVKSRNAHLEHVGRSTDRQDERSRCGNESAVRA